MIYFLAAHIASALLVFAVVWLTYNLPRRVKS